MVNFTCEAGHERNHPAASVIAIVNSSRYARRPVSVCPDGSVTATVYFGGFDKVIATTGGGIPFGTMFLILLSLIPFAVLMSAIGAFYYLRVVKLMYFDDPVDRSAIEAHGDARALLSVNGLALLALGILPQPLMGLCVIALAQSQFS